jgi:hypothetical protein
MSDDFGDAMLKGLSKVTKAWTKQRRAEERSSSAYSRREYWVRDYDFQKEVAWEVMPSVYAKVSDNGRLPALARQLMYAARPIIQERTGKLLDSKYFTQTLLPDYIAEHGCDDWLVVYDARGHLYEPHTDLMVPLGTLAVRQHLKDADELVLKPEDYKLAGKLYPTIGPRNRYGDVLFLEKEGFHPLLNAVKLQERRDIAVMSTKGMSVTAARELIDSICARTNNGVPVRLLVLHDFDKSGFSIVGTLQRATRRYTFQNDVEMIDLGLRMEDIAGLESEPVYLKKNQTRSAMRWNLKENGATEQEINFLAPKEGELRRVELNAMTSDQLVRFIEGKLDEHGVEKVIPDEGTMTDAYRRAYEACAVQTKIDEMVAEIRKRPPIDVPPDLAAKIEAAFEQDPARPWDAVIARLVKESFPK